MLALGLFVYVISQTDFEQLYSLKDRLSWGWLGITFLAFLLMLAIKTYQYHVFTGRKLGYFRVLEIVVVQNLLMNFVATAAGIASYLTMLGIEEDVRLGKATESFVLVKIGDVIAVSVYFLFSMLFIRPLPKGVLPIISIVGGFILIFLIVLLALLFYRDKFLAVLKDLIKLIKLDKINLVIKMLGYLEKIVAYQQSDVLQVIGRASLISFAYMGMTLAWGYARFMTFSLPLNFFVVIFVFSLLQFASWVPIYIFGGLGLSEGIWMFLLGLFLSKDPALAAVLIGIRILNYIFNAITSLYLPIYSFFSGSSAVK